jgi:antitoxin VapB
MTEQKAKVFWSGRSQAVRIPKEFRFDADEVTIRREGDVVILEAVEAIPANDDPWAWIDKLPGKFSDGAVAATEEDIAPQERPDLDRSFK